VSWTKRDIIGQAFSEIGLASYTFDLLPEQWEGALRRLDAMIAQWENKGIRLAWPLPVSFANSSIDDGRARLIRLWKPCISTSR
jgi:hypothetical protein